MRCLRMEKEVRMGDWRRYEEGEGVRIGYIGKRV
jgi:hypothetical protein